MKNRMKKALAIAISSVLSMGILAGCTVTIDPGTGSDQKINITLPETDEEEPVKFSRSMVMPHEDNSFAVGTWYTEDYDEDENWALSYKIELAEDGTALVEGWRNKDSGTYEVTGDDTVLITLDDCMTSSFHSDYKKEPAYSYTIDMTINGDDAQIKVNTTETISNLEDGVMYREEKKSGFSRMPSSKDASFAVGTWYTEGYDLDELWSVSYKIELAEDGTATILGYRNKDSGTYEVTGKDTVLITLDDCWTSSFANGFKKEVAYEYTVELKVKGDEGKIKVNAPEVISNLADGNVYRKDPSEEEGDEGEGVDIANGRYLTDEEYEGELSSDGKTMTITTALNHEDDDWNLVEDYEKRTYVFTVSDKCKCIVAGEKREEDSFFDRLDFIEDFLEGNSGLPILLTIKNNELVEILFSS